MTMLEIHDLTVSVNGYKILKNIHLDIPAGETVVLFGPNGSGKTTLLMAILGFNRYKIESGSITFKGQEITHLPVDERVRLGLGMMFQRPPTVDGVSVREVVRLCNTTEMEVDALAQRVNASDFLDRSINAGFSGGEIKRSELLQLSAQQPDLLLLDEPESGVDIENIALIGRTIGELLDERIVHPDDGLSMMEQHRRRKRSGLVITHTGYILDYVSADRGIVFMNGHIVCKGNPSEILKTIRKSGFEECKRCEECKS